MLQAIVGAVGGFVFGAVTAVLLMWTAVKPSSPVGLDKEGYFFAAAIGGGALAGPCSVLGATSALLNAIRARQRGHVE
jgi:hypothetical protein